MKAAFFGLIYPQKRQKKISQKKLPALLPCLKFFVNQATNRSTIPPNKLC
jgi:hypothetical protein